MKWLVLLFSFSLCAVDGISFNDKRGLNNYKFVLLMPKNKTSYFCAVFSLDNLRVCRFPNGPMWSNSLGSKKLYTISNNDVKEIKKHSKSLPVLCIDEAQIRNRRISRCNKDVCGFALPWETGMAYVFDDLSDVGRVSGVIVENKYLNKINLPITRSLNVSLEDDDFDEIDMMIEDNSDEDFDAKSLPYPLEKMKIFLGKILIYGLVKYHDVKSKLVSLIKSNK